MKSNVWITVRTQLWVLGPRLGKRRAGVSDSHRQVVVRVHKRERLACALHHAIHVNQLRSAADEGRTKPKRSAFSAVAIRWNDDALYIVDVCGADQSAYQLTPAKYKEGA